jgi:NAD(P)-dependent dehydrogenase (short-subunit alcohol dehydrogenase family)
MTSRLAGKVVLVTGAARGIGEHTARLAAARGARLALVGLEPDRLAALAGELGAHWAECDVTDQAGLDAAVASTLSRLGGIDVVVANAGVANIGTVAVGPADAFARTIDVNLTGVVRTISAVLPSLVASRGYALLVSSAAAFTAMPGMAAYAASKAGVEQFGNVLRMEVAHLGVGIGIAHPVWIDTDLVRGFHSDLPSFRTVLDRLPWPLRSIAPVEACAAALVRAVERRQRRVFVPRSIAIVHALRTLALSPLADWLVARGTDRGALIGQLEDEARELGRSFGRHSAG